MATDAAAIAMALFAMWIAERTASVERTYGFYRTEIIAALLNALALWLIVGWIFFEAIERFRHHDLHVDGWPVLFVGLGGLFVNLVTAWILHRQSEHSLNVEGAFQHVMADLMGSVAVVVSAILIITLDWTLADPILSVAIGLLIMLSSWRLVTKVFHVLLEGTPERLDMYRLCSDIEDLPGVTLVHDVHAWTITSGSEAFTAHVLIDPSYEGDMDEPPQPDAGHHPQQVQHRSRHHPVGAVRVRLQREPPCGPPGARVPPGQGIEMRLLATTSDPFPSLLGKVRMGQKPLPARPCRG